MYLKAKDLLLELKLEKGEKIDLKVLINKIKLRIGADENRTVKPYIKFMLDMNLIKSHSEGGLIICYS